MESYSADEPEPEQRRRLVFRLLSFFSVLLIVVAACENRKWQKPEYPVTVIDSTVIKQREKLQQDSLQQASITKKKIYLTFDDGPNKGTRNVLTAIKEENIPVSFFIVGEHVFDSPEQQATWEMLKADTAIELCNHSYSHAHNRYTVFYKNPKGVIEDFNHSQEQLHFTNNIVRMPGRNAWRIDTIDHTDINESRAAIDSLHAAGFNILGWDIEWMFDHKTLAPDTAIDLMLRRIKNMLEANKTKTPGHLVLLAHDQSFKSEEAVQLLHLVLQSLKNNPEYELVLAGKYPGIRKG
jgi:peptidoglycan-N-acetylglucosamine deacetylase